MQSLLEGRAKDAISGLAITDANYSIAIDLLTQRFGDKERAVAAHMDDLMSVEAVLSDSHLVELRRLYDKTESSIRSLEALGVRIDSYGALLTPVFVKKLPAELRLTLARKVPQSEWNMTRILEVCLEELEARERASLPKDKPIHRRFRDHPSAKTFVTNGQAGCCYCGDEDHSPIHCKRVVRLMSASA